jgi:hypothetical protein
MPRRFHVDDAGRLRSGWPHEAETAPEPDEWIGHVGWTEPTPPNAADGGAQSNRDIPQPVDMNQLIRDAFGHGGRWP